MAKGKDTVFVPVLHPDPEKCSIKFDQDLEELLDAQGIEDRGEQMLVLNALCALGLADCKMYLDNNGSQERAYTSTKVMRKLVKEWLYSPKRWRLPGER
jgi:hypothetical protein